MVAVLRAALLCAFAVGSASAEAVELTAKNFNKKVFKKDRAAFVKFQAPW